MSRRDGNIVVEAKAHRSLAFCVVTRRPDESERASQVRRADEDSIDSRQSCACRQQRYVVRLRRCKCIGIESDDAAGSAGHELEVAFIVDTQ